MECSHNAFNSFDDHLNAHPIHDPYEDQSCNQEIVVEIFYCHTFQEVSSCLDDQIVDPNIFNGQSIAQEDFQHILNHETIEGIFQVNYVEYHFDSCASQPIYDQYFDDEETFSESTHIESFNNKLVYDSCESNSLEDSKDDDELKQNSTIFSLPLIFEQQVSISAPMKFYSSGLVSDECESNSWKGGEESALISIAVTKNNKGLQDQLPQSFLPANVDQQFLGISQLVFNIFRS